MISFTSLRRRIAGEYPSSLLTSYLAMGVNIVAQIILVPIYLTTLGVKDFGILMLMLALIAYAGAGIGWVGGVLQRIFGEAFGTGDNATFVRALGLGKFIYIAYAAAAALVAIGTSLALYWAEFPQWTAVFASLFLLAGYELGVERMALTAAGRQSASNLLQFSQTLLYALSVPFILLAGWGLPGVFACQLGAVLATRAFVPFCWRGARPGPERSAVSARPLLSRLVGRMSGGYFIAGVLLLSTQSDVLLIGWLGGAEAATRFVLVWKIAEVGIQVLWRIPEMMIPILIRLDAVGDRATIQRQYRRVGWLLLAAAISGGIVYALLGPWITTLWLGAEHAPRDPLGFALAGAGIVWVGLARLPSVLAYSLACFRIWNGLAFLEVAARLGLTVALYPRFGYLSPLIALNIVHVCGLAVAYQWAGQRLLAGPI